MSRPGEDRDFQRRLQRVEALLQDVEQGTDERGREAAREVVQTLMELHGAALSAMLAAVDRPTLDAFTRDGLIGSVLLLHGLHPVDLATRVREAVDRAGPVLRAEGADVELLGVADGLVRVRLVGDARARAALEEALAAAAPDAAGVEIEQGATPSRLVALPLIGR